MRSTPLAAAPYPGYRAVHAKGTVCSGTFTPTPEASRLSRAAHLQGDPVEATSASRTPAATRDLGRPPDRRPRHGRQVPPAGRRRDRHRLRAAGRVHGPDARGLPRVHPGPDPRPRDRPPGPGEARRVSSPSIPRPASPSRRAWPSSPRPPASRPPTTAACTPSAWSTPRAASTGAATPGSRRQATEYLTDEQREAAAPRLPAGGDPRAARLGHRPVHPRVHARQRRRPARRPDRGMGGRARGGRARRARADRGDRGPRDPREPLVFDPMRLTDGIEPSDDKILAARPKAYAVSIERRRLAPRR